MIDLTTLLPGAWLLLQDVSIGVGANELHRRLVEHFQKEGAANLDIQKALYGSLLEAIDSLRKALTSEEHPYYQAIENLQTRREERERVDEIFKGMRAKFPKVSALKSPVPTMLEGSAGIEVKNLLGRLGLEDELVPLPEPLCNSFESQLPIAMLAHFRWQVATDSRLFSLLQLDLTTTGFQTLQRELSTISDFLHQKCGSDDPTRIQLWPDNLTDELKHYLASELGQVIERKFEEYWYDDDLFRLVVADSKDKTLARYFFKKAEGHIYVNPKLAEDFSEMLERNGSLLIRGLPGSGKTITGLALAESFHKSRYRIVYVSLRHEITEDSLVKGIRRRLEEPTVFILDDCHEKFDLLEKAQDRLVAEMRGRAYLIFMARTTPTPAGITREDEVDFVEGLKEAAAILEFRPSEADFKEIIIRVKPHFAGLSNMRLKKIFEYTGHDLFLLDQLIETIDSPRAIDQLKLDRLFAETRKHYFGSPTLYYPGFMNLAALAQFDLAPPVGVLAFDLEVENENAAAQLVMKADFPPRYYFLHSSAAELVFRSLAVGDHIELAVKYLIEFFKCGPLGDRQIAVDLANVIGNQLKLTSDEKEEIRLKSQFLSDDAIYALVEKTFDQLPLNLLAICLIILKDADKETCAHYQDLVKRKIDDGTVLNLAITRPSWENSRFLFLLRHEYPLLQSALSGQLAIRGIRSLTRTTELLNFLLMLAYLTEPQDTWWVAPLDSIPDNEINEMIERTSASGRFVGTIGLALRALKQTNPALLEKLEWKIGAKRNLHLIANTGTIFELFKVIENSSPSMVEALIEALDAATLDTLIAKTIASGCSIGTIHFTLRELKQTNLALLEKMERKIGGRRYLHLIASAGTISELFNVIRYSSTSMAEDLIEALDTATLGTLIAKTIASGRSIGTLDWALRELKQTNPALLEKLERKIGAKRYLHLISSAGTIFELFKVIEDSSPSMAEDLIEALDVATLDTLIAKTIASGRSIGNIHWAMRELKQTSPGLLEKLEWKIGAKRWWQIICANGDMQALLHILQDMDESYRRELVQGSQNVSLEQWQQLLLRGNFADLCNFVRWSSLFFSEYLTDDFLSSLKPTFERLIREGDWKVLDQGASLLRESSDSLIKKCLSDLLRDYLAQVRLESLSFDSFGKAVHCVKLLWTEVPSRREELTRFLLTILPEEKVWYADEEFIRSARLLFFILATPQVRPDDARGVLAIGNREHVAVLCEEATTLDLFLYLWNLYALWFQWERTEGQTFEAFLNAEIVHTVSDALRKRSQAQTKQEETDNLITLTGFLSFVGVSIPSEERTRWSGRLLSFERLLARAATKTFIPAVFFLLGLEWIFDGASRVPTMIWRGLPPKARDYSEKLSAIEHLHEFVLSRTTDKNGLNGHRAD